MFLTHGHADAAGGLRALDAWAARRTDAPLAVFTDRRTRTYLLKTFRHLPHLVVRPLVAKHTIRIGPLSILPFRVRHANDPRFPTHGFLFNDILGYASEVAALPPSAQRVLRNIHTLVLDAALYFGKNMPTHLAADDAIRIGEALGVRRLILTQIGHSYPPHGIAARAVRRRSGIARLAYDGMRIRCGS